MGTNFYSLSGIHIGKRSAAGKYCWDCKTTLCKKGEAFVHYNAEWYDSCPICGKPYIPPENLFDTAIGQELGFSTIKGKQVGVKTCSSFTWAVLPERVKRYKGIKDEYGRVLTLEEFKEMLELCPLQYVNLIGKEFC